MARFNTAASAAPAWSEEAPVKGADSVPPREVLVDDLSDLSLEPGQDAFVDEMMPGTRLLQGQYTIVSYLNAGGFGITYLAKTSLDRMVVIKECFPNSLCRRSGVAVSARSRAQQVEFRAIVQLFVQEARSLSKLEHPNIVGVHQVFEDNNTAYMVMDHIDGKDLLDRLDDSEHPFTPAETVAMLKKVLGAVEFVHRSGMLHRDISPDNILIDAQGNPILIDFGAAREQATKASRVMSQRRVVKDGYSPQEFYLTGAAQGPYSDLYALAATFYHVISGEAPPESQRRLAAIAENSPDPYQPLANRIEGYPPNFLTAIDTALHVLPKERLASARQWLDLITTGEAETRRRATNPAALSDRTATSRQPPRRIVVQSKPPAPLPVTPEATPLNAALTTALRTGTAAAEAAAEAAAPRRGRAPLVIVGMAALALALGGAFWSTRTTTDDQPPATLIAGATMVAPSVAADAGAAARAAAEVAAKAHADAEAEAEAAATAAAATEAANAAIAAEAAKATADAAATSALATDAEALAAKKAAVVPRPALPDTPVLKNQFATTAWLYDLPFSAEPAMINGRSFPVITAVDPDLAKANTWVAPGVAIFAINGTLVADVAALESRLRVSTSPDATGMVAATARTRALDAVAFNEVTLTAPATRRAVLKNGTVFVTGFKDSAWQTVVESIVYSDDGGLAFGDVILSEQTLKLPVNASDRIEIILHILSDRNVPEAVFEVLRNGVVTTARMPLERK